MASKNHRRYKLRKHMNTIKHVPKSLFDAPPLLISTWEELSTIESTTHLIEVDVRGCNGTVKPKVKFVNAGYHPRSMYLSTHTFYEGTYFYTTGILRKLGFNIQLANWDGETVYYPN